MTKPLPERRELILIVDDEESILAITSDTLEVLGYRAITATNGAEALTCYSQHHAEIAAVILDMSMPIMDGLSAVCALQSVNPDVKIIASTGGIDPIKSSNESGQDAVRAVLYKPYTAEALLQTLREVIGAGRKKKRHHAGLS